jgi:hypothetical protein
MLPILHFDLVFRLSVIEQFVFDLGTTHSAHRIRKRQADGANVEKVRSTEFGSLLPWHAEALQKILYDFGSLTPDEDHEKIAPYGRYSLPLDRGR